MIEGEAMEKAEKILSIRGDLGGMEAVHETAGVNSDALAKLVQHHVKGTLVQRMPNLDPRIEPVLNTLLAHFFMVGVMCGLDEKEQRSLPR